MHLMPLPVGLPHPKAPGLNCRGIPMGLVPFGLKLDRFFQSSALLFYQQGVRNQVFLG